MTELHLLWLNVFTHKAEQFTWAMLNKFNCELLDQIMPLNMTKSLNCLYTPSETSI